MFKKVLPFVPIALLYGFTINLLVVVATTSITLQKAHYLGFAILFISTLLFLINQVAGHLGTGLLLLFGAFARASLTPAVHTVTVKFIVGITFSPDYLALFILFLIINGHSISDWVRTLFSEK